MKWKAAVKCQYVGTGEYTEFTTEFEAETKEDAETYADHWAAAFDLDGYYADAPVVKRV
jgi:hypothetical protein